VMVPRIDKPLSRAEAIIISSAIKELSHLENQPALPERIITVISVKRNSTHGVKRTNIDIQCRLCQTQP
jgi:hypothetical protein